MKDKVMRIFVEKKKDFAVEAGALYADIRENLGIAGLQEIRIVNRYDVCGISEIEYIMAKNTIFSEPPVDTAYDESLPINPEDKVFAMEYLPGQYDQRADSAAQCIQILTQRERPIVKTAKLIILKGDISDNELERIKGYCINPLEAREASLSKPESLDEKFIAPDKVEVLTGFIIKNHEELESFMEQMGLAMSLEDLCFCQEYFRDIEKRDPTITEIKVIDTYWSDHCRHTTFLTNIQEVHIEEGKYTRPIKEAFELYKEARKYVYDGKQKDMSLMDIAVIAMKELKKSGQLNDLEESEEINACSIIIEAKINGEVQEWLLMFKNETHNHPTEIEPFGGAATCLGGAIRDPLSGRAYVFGAIRVTGSGDPRASVEDTLVGKLPQRKITTGASLGYSSYGNQIGLATGQVAEIYDEGFIAKRMEIGAVIGAAPRENVIREIPQKGDAVVLLGGRTGRDGCGGATGSSKEHTEESIANCGAEVQKGNAPTERKLQRLFRIPEVSRIIKRCNDFGAGGVSVAIGELAQGLLIALDAVPKKYEGLDGTELAISESQERMAVVVSEDKVQQLFDYAYKENLEATVVARVTDNNRLRMLWQGNIIVDLSREFLDTNGVRQNTWVRVASPNQHECFIDSIPDIVKHNYSSLPKAWLSCLEDLNICSQKGLVERFDSTIGAGTILMPYGGKYQDTPAEGLAMKLPVIDGDTATGVLMTYGYNPSIGRWSPFHGAYYAVVEAVAKIAALGGDYSKVRLTFQEYFEKLGKDPIKWGKPFSALLGAYYAQKHLQIPAIGGKDSMSGTFKDMNVPPTLVAFAVNVIDADKVISQEFKGIRSNVVLLKANTREDGLLDIENLTRNFKKVKELSDHRLILASSTIRYGGIAAAISKMCFGSKIGFKFGEYVNQKSLFTPQYGSIILELSSELDLKETFEGTEYKLLGNTQEKPEIFVNGYTINIDEALKVWKAPLERVFPTGINSEREGAMEEVKAPYYTLRSTVKPKEKLAKPRIFIPVFPGTNCEGDTARAFKKAGAAVTELVFNNLSSRDIEESVDSVVKIIENSQIIAIPGGFSGGDEPDGAGKFIATVFRNPRIQEAVMRLMNQRDGLMLGICNGFQALVKLGLLPYGRITDLSDNSPTLTYNQIGHHVSGMVHTKVISVLSPWLAKANAGDIHTIAISHGEGRFVTDAKLAEELFKNGQIATQYVDYEGKASMAVPYNLNGSMLAIEGITSPDGRILGKMGHSERVGTNVGINVPGEKEQRIFEAGVEYFG